MREQLNPSFSENDIRPSNLMEGERKAVQEDLKRLAAKKDGFVLVGCPACGSNNSMFAFEKYSFDFVSCRECDTVYMNPRATPEILNDFYANSVVYEYWNKYIFPASREARRKSIFIPRVRRIVDICTKFGVSLNCLVEVGGGFGIFCEEARAAFNRVIAIEPNSMLAESCRSIGVETIENTVENILSLEVKPDVVASFEVIEHLFSPRDFLLNCKHFMAPGSLIAITCPNYKGFGISTLGLKSESIDAEHINLFNPYATRLLFERCGFEVLECLTPGELDADIVRNKVLSGDFDISGQPFLKTVLIDGWEELGMVFQEFLKTNNLSSNMWAVAKSRPA